MYIVYIYITYSRVVWCGTLGSVWDSMHLHRFVLHWESKIIEYSVHVHRDIAAIGNR